MFFPIIAVFILLACVNSQTRESREEVELESSFGSDTEAIKVASDLIRKYVKSGFDFTEAGEDAGNIETGMEERFSGLWNVAIYRDSVDLAYSIIRRAPVYLKFRYNDQYVVIARESEHPRMSNPKD